MSSTAIAMPLTVTDIKQYLYCPRLLFYTYCLPVPRPVTYKMEEGKEEHVHTVELEARRSLRAYGLLQGERLFTVSLHSPTLHLSGLLDMLVLTADAAIPVEYKNTNRKPGRNHCYQLAAYALLVEEAWQRPVQRGFFYLIPRRRANMVNIEPAWKEHVLRTLQGIREMVAAEHMPAPTRQRGRCVNCEYRLYCADVEISTSVDL